MTAHLSRRETHPRSIVRQAAARLRRLAVALTAAACGLLASALVHPGCLRADDGRSTPEPGRGRRTYSLHPAARQRRRGPRRHGGLADYLDRRRRRPGRGHRGRAAGPGVGRPPVGLGNPHLTRPPAVKTENGPRLVLVRVQARRVRAHAPVWLRTRTLVRFPPFIPAIPCGGPGGSRAAAGG